MLRLATFGGPALLGDNGPVAGAAARPRQLALLALLARAGEAGLSREKISAFLWPESDAERAGHSLHQAVYTLRRALGDTVFRPGTTSLALNGEVLASDVVVFERRLAVGDLAGAVTCYRGAFLDGFHLSEAPDFERWVDGERGTLHRAYVAALERLARDAERLGDAALSIGYWRRLAAAEPLSAPVALGLMRALEQAGDRTGALQAGELHARMVRHDLEVAADPSVSQFLERLREVPPRAPRLPASERAPIAGGTLPALDAPPALASIRARARRANSWRAALAVVAAGILLSGTILVRRDRPTSDRPPGVAVIPFENETGDPALAALGRMAADWITDGLLATGLVRVTDPARPRAADAVVTGRIYRTGDSVRIEAQVTRTRDGEVLRTTAAIAGVGAQPASALPPLRDRLLGALGTLYDRRLASFTAPDAHPPAYKAYQAFAAGMELLAQPRDVAAAEAQFRRAGSLDTTYVLPRLWLAWGSIIRSDFASADSLAGALRSRRDHMSVLERAWLDRITALLAGNSEASYLAARRMVAASPGTGWSIALASAALDTDRPAEAINVLRATGMEHLGLEAGYGWFLLTSSYHLLGEYQRELAASDTAVSKIGLGWGFLGAGVPALAALGRFDALERRLAELRHAPRLEGGRAAGPTALFTAATELRAHGFADSAQALVDRWFEEDTSSPFAGSGGLSRQSRANLLYEMGRWDEAARSLATASDDVTDPMFDLGMRGLLAARRGDSTAARRLAEALAHHDDAFAFGAPALWRARIAAALGDDARAIMLLRQAFAQGQGGDARYLVHVSRDFDGLRDDAGFQELVRPRP